MFSPPTMISSTVPALFNPREAVTNDVVRASPKAIITARTFGVTGPPALVSSIHASAGKADTAIVI